MSSIPPPRSTKARAEFLTSVRDGMQPEYRIHQVGKREALMRVTSAQPQQARYREASETVTLVEWLEPASLAAPAANTPMAAPRAAAPEHAATGKPRYPLKPWRELPFGLLHAAAVYPIQQYAFQMPYSFKGYMLLTALVGAAWASSARRPTRLYLWLAPSAFFLQIALPAAWTPDYYMKWWHVAYMFPVWCLSLLAMRWLEHATAERSAAANSDVRATERARANVLVLASAFALALTAMWSGSDSKPWYLILIALAGVLAYALRSATAAK